ncbi:hypothetical protein ASPSYDRAFT_32114 [Aspergillus sydowii CBS 593.65]|uniref:Uncharacterized protein n=1 Tax=Aspergillus sydowii CBS 593.65 TaxID=1036612 RepID=A0A1L9TF26_9EURO|nr:uncharacterized protein ASPSYDRAFT_32114 [Aspergillus sydowii CBS 593.65]OJJ58037.1 hypothetical protein ASPSYDRAFT_32114 [Aspergillus sydowii CBS 593.65]
MAANDFYNQGPPGGYQGGGYPPQGHYQQPQQPYYPPQGYPQQPYPQGPPPVRHRWCISSNPPKRRRAAVVSEPVLQPSAAASSVRKPASAASTALNAAKCVKRLIRYWQDDTVAPPHSKLAAIYTPTDCSELDAMFLISLQRSSVSSYTPCTCVENRLRCYDLEE